jgi:hypothetical protein
VSDVGEIEPQRQRLVLRRAPERASHHRLGRLRPHATGNAWKEPRRSSR